MFPWSGGQPADFGELFEFYYKYVKLLYSYVQTSNVLPAEVLFELNAALDHIARKWTYDNPEGEVVARAYGHLKRSCLDIFKLKVHDCYDEYAVLCKVDTSVIDNGDFDRELRALYARIRELATEARRVEGQPDTSLTVPAFALWEQVFILCLRLEKDFFLSPKVNWAKRRNYLATWSYHFNGIAIGMLTSGMVGILTVPKSSEKLPLAIFMGVVVVVRGLICCAEHWYGNRIMPSPIPVSAIINSNAP